MRSQLWLVGSIPSCSSHSILPSLGIHLEAPTLEGLSDAEQPARCPSVNSVPSAGDGLIPPTGQHGLTTLAYFRGAVFHIMYHIVMLPSARYHLRPMLTGPLRMENHLRPLPRGESCNATNAYLHKHDSNENSGSRRPTKCRLYDSGPDGRDNKDHAPCSSCQPRV